MSSFNGEGGSLEAIGQLGLTELFGIGSAAIMLGCAFRWRELTCQTMVTATLCHCRDSRRCLHCEGLLFSQKASSLRVGFYGLLMHNVDSLPVAILTV